MKSDIEKYALVIALAIASTVLNETVIHGLVYNDKDSVYTTIISRLHLVLLTPWLLIDVETRDC